MDFYANPIAVELEVEHRLLDLHRSISNRPSALPLTAVLAARLSTARHRLAHLLHGGSHTHSGLGRPLGS